MVLLDEKIIRLFRKMRLPAMAETYECMVAEGLLNSIAICSDISLMRNVKLLIIDDWLNAEVDEKGVLLIKEVLDYRTNKVGTILVSHCDPKGWKDRLCGTKAMVTSLIENLGKPIEIRLKDISKGTEEET